MRAEGRDIHEHAYTRRKEEQLSAILRYVSKEEGLAKKSDLEGIPADIKRHDEGLLNTEPESLRRLAEAESRRDCCKGCSQSGCIPSWRSSSFGCGAKTPADSRRWPTLPWPCWASPEHVADAWQMSADVLGHGVFQM